MCKDEKRILSKINSLYKEDETSWTGIDKQESEDIKDLYKKSYLKITHGKKKDKSWKEEKIENKGVNAMDLKQLTGGEIKKEL